MAGSPQRPTARLHFAKYEGAGNDFLVVDAENESDVTSDRAARLCDRHFGVGADGVLVVLPSRTPEGDARMRVINPDGSVPEMCGNGARCVALHIAILRGMSAGTVRLDTDAGVRACAVETSGSERIVTVSMGPVRVLGERAIDVDGNSLALTTADSGNPHAVLFGAFTRSDIERLGPRLATHPEFPGGTNVEFAHVTDDGIDLTVWERGAGITLACGTGACAAVAVACGAGRVVTGKRVRVRLPGGSLEVVIDEEGHATLRGPARRVFEGTTFE